MANIFCYAEAASFPDTEFRRDPNGQLHHPPIHETRSPHYRSGQPLHSSPVPLVQIVDLTAKLHELALSMSAEGIQDLIDYAQKKSQA